MFNISSNLYLIEQYTALFLQFCYMTRLLYFYFVSSCFAKQNKLRNMYLKGKCFKFVVSALVSTFYTFVEEMLVFYELELIITLDITIFGLNSWIGASVSTFCMFVEDIFVFANHLLICPERNTQYVYIHYYLILFDRVSTIFLNLVNLLGKFQSYK